MKTPKTIFEIDSATSSGSSEEKAIDPVEIIPLNQVSQTTVEASLQGKPQRPILLRAISFKQRTTGNSDHEGRRVPVELKGPPSRSSLENSDWSKAESLVKVELQADVELIRSSTRGFAVSIHLWFMVYGIISFWLLS
ncbi:BnaCnng53360D [Brassica napus]|uniref:BnaCnng53360D protein n=1 Tax=Brassica napus TaxID=3708 RepID=A0A078JHH8_BRANA|nr:BnaCnng53360D [Brassica napus]